MAASAFLKSEKVVLVRDFEVRKSTIFTGFKTGAAKDAILNTKSKKSLELTRPSMAENGENSIPLLGYRSSSPRANGRRRKSKNRTRRGGFDDEDNTTEQQATMDGFPNNEHSLRGVKFPCGTCGKAMRSADRGVFCEVCLYWLYCCCVSICAVRYKVLQDSEGGWACPACTHSALPFADCSRLSLGDDREAVVGCPSLSSTSSSIATASRLGGLSVYYANCRSILPKIEDLLCLVASSDPPNRLDRDMARFLDYII